VDKAAVDVVRRFHRTVGEELGIVGDRFLGRQRPPGESRLLWEIGPDGAELRELRRRLGLDSGYLTRAMQALERQRLVRVSVNRSDHRVRRATLTRRGRAERALLDRRSDAAADRTLRSLTDGQRTALVRAMADVDRLLRASLVSFAVESPRSFDARWCIEQYFNELNTRFEGGFRPELSIPADARELTPPAGLLLLARLSGQPVGCGALKYHGKEPAELKRMWLAKSVRGLGVGARMLAELERRARRAGARTVRLETNRTLAEAIALYRRSGYVEVPRFNDEPYAHHWFEKRLTRKSNGE
jgi:DNA-binding MarR family transcriptional regulator/GNAT superfamily N-acetyltransferase